MARDVLVECKHLAVGRNDAPVLRELDLEVARGEIVALLGASGCGKSTLMRTIGGLLPPIEGEVRVLGEPLYDILPEERSAVLRRIGVAFQQDALFSSLTIEDNVALPLREVVELPDTIAKEMVHMRLALVGLAGLEKRQPAQLSGGQRKRAAIARATILDPELLLCDEPSAGLDPVVGAELDQMLLELREVFGTTIVVVSHELESVRAIADRAVMFEGGKIRAIGTIDELARSRDRVVHEFFHARTA